MRCAIVVLLVSLLSADQETRRPDLSGVVLNQDGDPVAGARVFIYTASFRKGLSPYCPSCYPDCGKHADTDAKGRFTVLSLDPELVFRILVVAENHRPTFVSKVDPGAGPIQVKVEPADPTRLKPGHVLRGRVAGPDGEPVVGAVVSTYGVKAPERGGVELIRVSDPLGVLNFSGPRGAADRLAVTNSRGEFALTCSEPDLSLIVQVQARGLAPQLYRQPLPTGEWVHQLKLGYGASVSGRVLKDGKPVPGVSVGLSQVDRALGNYVADYEIATDEHGRFLFANVAPNFDYYVYGKMETLRDLGTVGPKRVRVGPDGCRIDAGDLEVGPAYRLVGRVVLSDGKAIPAHTRLVLLWDPVVDSQMVELGPTGGFEFAGVPAGTIAITVTTPGYRLSSRNKSLDLLNPWQLIGRVSGDSALRVLMEPLSEAGRLPDRRAFEALPESERPRNRPLQGIPLPAD